MALPDPTFDDSGVQDFTRSVMDRASQTSRAGWVILINFG